MAFQFSETIAESYREDLEQLFFFNPNQQRYMDQIVQIVDAFGQPKINSADGELTLFIDQHPEIRNLFALHENFLVGVAVFAQFTADTLSILHMAVHPDYTLRGSQSCLYLTDTIFDVLRQLALDLHTVTQMTFGYAKGEKRILALPLD